MRIKLEARGFYCDEDDEDRNTISMTKIAIEIKRHKDRAAEKAERIRLKEEQDRAEDEQLERELAEEME